MRELVLWLLALCCLPWLLLGCGGGSHGPGFKAEHKASFLFENARLSGLLAMSPGMPDHEFERLLAYKRAQGDTVVYVTFWNGADYGEKYQTSIYTSWANPGSPIDAARVEWMRGRLKTLRKYGFRPVWWGMLDDSPKINHLGVDAVKKYQIDVMRLFGDLLGGNRGEIEHVPGLEANEYWGANTVNELCRHVKTLGRPATCWSHETPGRWDFAQQPEVDGIYWQSWQPWDGPKKSAGDMERSIAYARSKVGKPVVAAEYHYESRDPHARALGDAARRAGAVGTGNGSN